MEIKVFGGKNGQRNFLAQSVHFGSISLFRQEVLLGDVATEDNSKHDSWTQRYNEQMKKLWLWLKKYRTKTQIVNVLSLQWQINEKMIGPIYSLIFMTATVYFSTSLERCKLKLAALQRFGCALPIVQLYSLGRHANQWHHHATWLQKWLY